jgi:hypothetical protein
MQELFPIALGFVLGAALGLLRPRLRLAVGVAASVALGAVATVATGEYRLGWEFVLVDIPLVGAAAGVCLLGGRALRRAVGLRRQRG